MDVKHEPSSLLFLQGCFRSPVLYFHKNYLLLFKISMTNMTADCPVSLFLDVQINILS